MTNTGGRPKIGGDAHVVLGDTRLRLLDASAQGTTRNALLRAVIDHCTYHHAIDVRTPDGDWQTVTHGTEVAAMDPQPYADAVDQDGYVDPGNTWRVRVWRGADRDINDTPDAISERPGVTDDRRAEILTALNGYAGDPSNIWGDVILGLDEYDDGAEMRDSSDQFFLVDGTEYRWDAQRDEWYLYE